MEKPGLLWSCALQAAVSPVAFQPNLNDNFIKNKKKRKSFQIKQKINYNDTQSYFTFSSTDPGSYRKLKFNEVSDASSDLFGRHKDYLERRQLCPTLLCWKLGESRAALDYRSSALREPCRSWISLISSEWEVNAFLKCLSAAWAELQLCCSSLTEAALVSF